MCGRARAYVIRSGGGAGGGAHRLPHSYTYARIHMYICTLYIYGIYILGTPARILYISSSAIAHPPARFFFPQTTLEHCCPGNGHRIRIRIHISISIFRRLSYSYFPRRPATLYIWIFFIFFCPPV